MSGECFLSISLIRWTVIGFPNPQQFQLSTAKEEEDFASENPPDCLLMSWHLMWVGEGGVALSSVLPFEQDSFCVMFLHHETF